MGLLSRLWQQRRWPRSTWAKVPRYSYEEERTLLRSLAQHPGWIMVMAGLNNQKAALERIHAGRTNAADMVLDAKSGGLDGLLRYHTEAVRLEEGIYRLGQIQDLVRRAEAFPELEPALEPGQSVR